MTFANKCAKLTYSRKSMYSLHGHKAPAPKWRIDKWSLMVLMVLEVVSKAERSRRVHLVAYIGGKPSLLRSVT